MLNVSAVHFFVIVSKVLIRSDWIFWSMRMLSLCTCFMQNPRDLCVCVSVSLFPSAPTSNFENDSQTQLNLNLVSPCGLWLSGKHFRSRDHITKHPKASDFFQSVAIYCRFGPFLWVWLFIYKKPWKVHRMQKIQHTKPEEFS